MTTPTTIPASAQIIADIFDAYNREPDHYSITWDSSVWTMADAQRMAQKIERKDPSVTGRYGKGWGYFHERVIGDLWDPSMDVDRIVEITTDMLHDMGQVIQDIQVVPVDGWLVAVTTLAPYYLPEGEHYWADLTAQQAAMAEVPSEAQPF